jgi:hypothetical protein
VLQGQGKYEDAEKLKRRALEGREKELGVHHLYTLNSVYYLAHLLHTTERYAEATELCERAYNGYVQKLDAQHPDTIACGNYLSTLQEATTQAAPADHANYATHSQEAVVTTVCPESAFGKASRRRNRKQASFFSRIRDNVSSPSSRHPNTSASPTRQLYVMPPPRNILRTNTEGSLQLAIQDFNSQQINTN